MMRIIPLLLALFTLRANAAEPLQPLTKKVEAKAMEQKMVRRLEKAIEEAVAEVIVGMGLEKLPLLPSRPTMHLMAKAAVTVYEGAVDNHRGSHDD